MKGHMLFRRQGLEPTSQVLANRKVRTIHLKPCESLGGRGVKSRGDHIVKKVSRGADGLVKVSRGAGGKERLTSHKFIVARI